MTKLTHSTELLPQHNLKLQSFSKILFVYLVIRKALLFKSFTDPSILVLSVRLKNFLVKMCYSQRVHLSGYIIHQNRSNPLPTLIPRSRFKRVWHIDRTPRTFQKIVYIEYFLSRTSSKRTLNSYQKQQMSQLLAFRTRKTSIQIRVDTL